MADRPNAHDFLYVHTDIPPGMTIAQWRAQRATSRPRPRRHVFGRGCISTFIARARRRCRQRRRQAGVGVRVLIGPVRQPSATRSWTRQPCPDGSLRES